jgi:hypothetical protein
MQSIRQFFAALKQFRFLRWLSLVPLFACISCAYSLIPIPPDLMESCNRLKITYLSGIANGPAKVIWEGGEGWLGFTVTLSGRFDESAVIPLGWGKAPAGSYSATFTIESLYAQQIVDYNGRFIVSLTANGFPDNPNAGCLVDFGLQVSDMVGVQTPTAIPTSVPPPPPPATNNPVNTPVPTQPAATEEVPPATPDFSGTQPVTG